MVVIDLFVLFAHDHSTNIYDRLSLILSWFTTIRPKIRVLINLFFLFLQDHSTKVKGHSFNLIYSFPSYVNILFAIFIAVLPLYFVHYIHGSAALIFGTLRS